MMRKVTGSIFSFSAISSIATSSAMRPGASPGARIALPSGRSSTARRVAVMRWAPAYRNRVCWVAFSGLPPARLPDQVSCPIEVILPSRVAPIRMRWIVAGRWVELLKINGRVNATLTGRFAARAPSAASSASARTNSTAAASRRAFCGSLQGYTYPRLRALPFGRTQELH
ncbi:MAG: hypothetical protein JWQ01_2999 [Massilia sp.]|nr:hypothetical protein [Massilia sp.]